MQRVLICGLDLIWGFNMGHYVSFWGMVKGRDVDCGTSEYAKICKE